eukprot:4604070-Pyramimonas_sp.AAC.1
MWSNVAASARPSYWIRCSPRRCGTHSGDTWGRTENKRGRTENSEKEEDEEEDASWESLGALLGPSGSFVGAFWVPLGGFLGAFLGLLGAVEGSLGGSLAVWAFLARRNLSWVALGQVGGLLGRFSARPYWAS